MKVVLFCGGLNRFFHGPIPPGWWSRRGGLLRRRRIPRWEFCYSIFLLWRVRHPADDFSCARVA